MLSLLQESDCHWRFSERDMSYQGVVIVYTLGNERCLALLLVALLHSVSNLLVSLFVDPHVAGSEIRK